MGNITSIIEEFSNLVTYAHGPKDKKIVGLSSPKLATVDHLIFISEEKYLREAQESRSRAWVVHKKLFEKLQDLPKDCLVLVTPNVQLSMALIAKRFFPVKVSKSAFLKERIHPTAVLHPTAHIQGDVVIGPNCTVGDGVRIGAGSVIGANTTIETGVQIGDRCHVHPQVYLGYGTQIGNDCEIHPQTSIGTEGFGYAQDEKGNHYRLTHYGRVVIGDRVQIGAGVQIDRGTFEDSQIGDGTIIDNHCHFGHNIKIGKNTIITGGLIAAGSVQIGSHCVFGGRTTIAGHIQIADGCHFAGLSGIHSSVDKPGAYGGYPLVPLKDSLKMYASLPQLPKLRRQVSRILRKLGLESDQE